MNIKELIEAIERSDLETEAKAEIVEILKERDAQFPITDDLLTCPKCDSSNYKQYSQDYYGNSIFKYYKCICGFRWFKQYRFIKWQEIPTGE